MGERDRIITGPKEEFSFEDSREEIKKIWSDFLERTISAFPGSTLFVKEQERMVMGVRSITERMKPNDLEKLRDGNSNNSPLDVTIREVKQTYRDKYPNSRHPQLIKH